MPGESKYIEIKFQEVPPNKHDLQKYKEYERLLQEYKQACTAAEQEWERTKPDPKTVRETLHAKFQREPTETEINHWLQEAHEEHYSSIHDPESLYIKQGLNPPEPPTHSTTYHWDSAPIILEQEYLLLHKRDREKENPIGVIGKFEFRNRIDSTVAIDSAGFRRGQAKCELRIPPYEYESTSEFIEYFVDSKGNIADHEMFTDAEWGEIEMEELTGIDARYKRVIEPVSHVTGKAQRLQVIQWQHKKSSTQRATCRTRWWRARRESGQHEKSSTQRATATVQALAEATQQNHNLVQTALDLVKKCLLLRPHPPQEEPKPPQTDGYPWQLIELRRVQQELDHDAVRFEEDPSFTSSLLNVAKSWHVLEACLAVLEHSMGPNYSSQYQPRQTLLELRSTQERIAHVEKLVFQAVTDQWVEVTHRLEPGQHSSLWGDQPLVARHRKRSKREQLEHLHQHYMDHNLLSNEADWEIQRILQIESDSAEAIKRGLAIISLPWWNLCDEFELPIPIEKAQRSLNSQKHGLHGLNIVKNRIIEHLAARNQRVKTQNDHRKSNVTEPLPQTTLGKGKAICLVGPPGIGKTSIAAAIATATGRTMQVIDLAGVDGHDLTGTGLEYESPQIGRIMEAIMESAEQQRRQGNEPDRTSKLLILLDEIDKVKRDSREGNPEYVLMKVLDTSRNHEFRDAYLDIPYDLSQIMFIVTANELDKIPMPLQDRMNVIELDGYTEDEKMAIAQQYTIPQLQAGMTLANEKFDIDQTRVRSIIRKYTQEAGVRRMQEMIERLAEKTAVEIETQQEKLGTPFDTEEKLSHYLGAPPFDLTSAEKKPTVGIARGLVVSEKGGSLLIIEAIQMPGTGRIKSTGRLKRVIRESITVASKYVQANAANLGIEPDIFGTTDIHVHLPKGDEHKDGPSAGIASVTAITSLLSNIPVRAHLAMTGEITATGKVLGIGGLKAKLLAAQRSGIKTVIIPAANREQLKAIPDDVRSGLDIHTAAHVREAIKLALVCEPTSTH